MKIKQKFITKTVGTVSGNAMYVNMDTMKIESMKFSLPTSAMTANTLASVRKFYENEKVRVIHVVPREHNSDKYGMTEIDFRQHGFIATKENVKAHKDEGKIMFRSFPVYTLSIMQFDLEKGAMETVEKFTTIDLEKNGVSAIDFARKAYETSTLRILTAEVKEKEFVKIGMSEQTFMENAHLLTKEELNDSDEESDEDSDEESDEESDEA